MGLVHCTEHMLCGGSISTYEKLPPDSSQGLLHSDVIG
jgi:hypothetical protein